MANKSREEDTRSEYVLLDAKLSELSSILLVYGPVAALALVGFALFNFFSGSLAITVSVVALYSGSIFAVYYVRFLAWLRFRYELKSASGVNEQPPA